MCFCWAVAVRKPNADEPTLSPEEFELGVKQLLESTAHGLQQFQTRHREVVRGVNGSYEIDVTARFRALDADFLVLVECKYGRKPITREVVQLVYDRVRSTGAHKGMVFATSHFQRGAIEYAQRHGIALVRVAKGEAVGVLYEILGALLRHLAAYLWYVVLGNERPCPKPPEPCAVVYLATDSGGTARIHEPPFNVLAHLEFDSGELIFIAWMVPQQSTPSPDQPVPIFTKQNPAPLDQFLWGSGHSDGSR